VGKFFGGEKLSGKGGIHNFWLLKVNDSLNGVELPELSDILILLQK